jgi:hypothetical protein
MYYQQGGQQDQIMQIIQAYAQMNQMDPKQLLEQFTKMAPEQQKQAIMQMAQTIQQGASQQQPDMAQAAMAYGGYTTGIFAGGGEMIRRADGSYSKRGLWDNIRANKGSGKKPTKQMLEQEKKIRNEEAAYGGVFGNGGTNNAGFNALPDYVQAKILRNMGYGGYYDPMELMGDGGEPNGEMALGQMSAVADKMNKLREFISPEQNLDPWIASKLAVMDHSADAISDYMMYNPEAQDEEMEMEEQEMKKGGSTFSGNAWYKMGGMPCYECGGMYAEGGYYDCPDQEKDPVTGKCSAEVARGKEAAAANKAANADMNAWAKQVAVMDKEVAKQNAAQYAGQLGFDYDWMGSPVEKAEKKAAMAQYKQFLQQNPNVFAADDSSGYSPEQKYIIASKLKQKASTPMGSKVFQQKFNQDANFFDLKRLQSDIVPLLGGWDATRNYLFNNKKYGGIHINPANKGKFTASAQRAGMGVQEFASHVLANKEDYNSTQVKRANFARNAASWNKQMGGLVEGDILDVTPEQLQMLKQGGYNFEIID